VAMVDDDNYDDDEETARYYLVVVGPDNDGGDGSWGGGWSWKTLDWEKRGAILRAHQKRFWHDSIFSCNHQL